MRSRHRTNLGLALASGAVLLFLHGPMGIILLYAFTTDESSYSFPPPGLTARLPDEGQPLGVFGAVDAVVVAAARGSGQQALALVVADGVGRGAGGLGQVADPHAVMVAP